MRNYIDFFLSDMQKYLRVVKKRVYTKIGSLNVEYTYAREPIPFAEKENGEFKAITAGEVWSGDQYGCGWFHFSGKVPESAAGKEVAFLVSIGGEGLVYENDTPIRGITGVMSLADLMQPVWGKRLIPFAKDAAGGEEFDFWVDAANNKWLASAKFLHDRVRLKAKLKQADIVVVNAEIKAFYYDIVVLMNLAVAVGKGTAKRKAIKNSIQNAIKAADNFSQDGIKAAREILANEMANGEESEFVSYCTGHAHLDLAWLWPIRETKRKAARTFTNQLRNIDEYPDIVFGASQPQQFEWMEELYPALFEQIKQRVADGRIELQGGMWCEPDCNVPSGEALVRQCLYGQRYWREKFGKEVNYCHIPDVFGYNGNLPQIIKKCGMPYFLTQKISWNEHNVFPHKTFLWKGIDGTDVLAHFPPEGTYNSVGAAQFLKEGEKKLDERDVVKVFSTLYGAGDGGGGPSEGNIEIMMRGQKLAGVPRVKFAHVRDLFVELEKKRGELKEYQGELYLEKHQGTFTTQAKTKYYNRKLEFLLQNTEFLFTVAGGEYPREEIEKIWKEVLLYQFHDILPGSSVARVYDECVPRYEKMKEDLLALQTVALERLGAGGALKAINPTGYFVNEIVKKDDKYYSVNLAPFSLTEVEEFSGEGALVASDNFIENEFYKVEFNKNGEISALTDKKSGKNYFGSHLNRFRLHKDKRLNYNAWDIDLKYVNKAAAAPKLIHHETSADNATAVRENVYKIGKSTITQKVVLTAGKPVLEFFTTVDWQETHKMLRVEFAPSVNTNEVTCDIQMGNIKRSTNNKTSLEKAQFEIAAQKWVDLSEKDFGFSVLSDCKYGWRVKENNISLNLLRSPMWPANDADKGAHTIKYAIYPHAGNVFEADTAKHAYIFNNPPILTQAGEAFNSYAQTDNQHVVIETIKPTEDGKGVTIRLYEDTGSEQTAALTLNKAVKKAYETDMLENKIADVEIKNLTFKPFEIKTVVLEF
jgi:alpha-mannosidase